MSDLISKTTLETEKLLSLLRDANPGLFTWNSMLIDQYRRLADLFELNGPHVADSTPVSPNEQLPRIKYSVSWSHWEGCRCHGDDVQHEEEFDSIEHLAEYLANNKLGINDVALAVTRDMVDGEYELLREAIKLEEPKASRRLELGKIIKEFISQQTKAIHKADVMEASTKDIAADLSQEGLARRQAQINEARKEADNIAQQIAAAEKELAEI